MPLECQEENSYCDLVLLAGADPLSILFLSSGGLLALELCLLFVFHFK